MAKKTERKTVKHPLLRSFIFAACILVLVVFIINVALNIYTRHNKYYKVPDLSGVPLEQAMMIAKQGNLTLEVTDSLYVPMYAGGVILEQRPKPESKVKSGRRVFLTVNSYKQRMVKVPFVAGYSLRQAKNNLELSGLVIEQLEYRDDLATNNVLEQYYDNKRITLDTELELEYGSSIKLIVGLGKDAPLQNMPKLIGLSLRDAQSRLWELGLNVGEISMDVGINNLNKTDAKVYAQSLEQAEMVKLGRKINLRITNDSDKVSKRSYSADSLYRAKVKELERIKLEQDSIDNAMLNPIVDTLKVEELIFEELINQAF